MLAVWHVHYTLWRAYMSSTVASASLHLNRATATYVCGSSKTSGLHALIKYHSPQTLCFRSVGAQKPATVLDYFYLNVCVQDPTIPASMVAGKCKGGNITSISLSWTDK